MVTYALNKWMNEGGIWMCWCQYSIDTLIYHALVSPHPATFQTVSPTVSTMPRSRTVHMASEQESSTPVTSCAKPQCLDRLKIVQIGLFQWLVSIFKVEIQVSIIVGLICGLRTDCDLAVSTREWAEWWRYCNVQTSNMIVGAILLLYVVQLTGTTD